MNLIEFRVLVSNNHRIPAGSEILSTGDDSQEDQAISGAVKAYSTRLPLVRSGSIVLTDHRGNLTDIAGWVDGWNVKEVYQDGIRLPGNTWVSGVSGEGHPQITASVTGTVQVIYGRTHELDSSGTTIPAIDHEAVSHLAASLVLSQAANDYAQKKNSSIDGDSVDYARLSGEYFMRSRDEAKLYEEHLKRRTPKRSATVNWSSRSRSGLGRMFQDDRFS
jgi:hypothetical protein